MSTKFNAILLTILAATLLAPPIAHAEPIQAINKDLDFKAAFPRPFYKKKYFGFALNGATIVSAGAISYLTAGAGAPIAATGVSTVASWVAGGGAGSYMAGLSTIGGWFGGNAMLGAAILNGISLGTVGGATSFAALNVGQKALVMGSIAATTLDGVALIEKPDTRELDIRVTPPVPSNLADKRLRQLIDGLQDAREKIEKFSFKLKGQSNNPSKEEDSKSVALTSDAMKLKQQLAAEMARREIIEGQIKQEIDRALNQENSNRNLLVLAVLAHNFGMVDKFSTLLNRIDASSGYLSYLRSLEALSQLNFAKAEELLRESSDLAPYAVEPSILIVNLLGRNFKTNKKQILAIAERADQTFSADAYAPSATLVSLHYRVGMQALLAKDCGQAREQFEQAEKQLSFIQKHVAGKNIRALLNIGNANAFYCEGKKDDAYRFFEKAKELVKDEQADELCKQYSGGCSN